MLTTKQTVIALSLSLFLGACASGGGGGGGPSTDSSNGGGDKNISKGDGNGSSNGNGGSDSNSEKSKYIKASKADKLTANGSNTKVIISDTGVNPNNKGLKDADINSQMAIYNKNKTTENGLDFVAVKDSATHGSDMAQIITKTSKKTNVNALAGVNAPNTYIHNAWAISAELNKKIHADVINNSWSDGGSLGKPELYKFHYKPVKDIIDSGTLFVTSSGNSGRDKPDDTALLPQLDSSLLKGFVVVASTDANGKILSNFNACGDVAKDYCMTAYGYADTYHNNGSVHNTYGTSNSAALVTGTALNIKSRYDWMTNEDLKNTLFSTADDKGAAGVDKVYGQGNLNQSKALNGYGRFDTETTLNVDGVKDTYYFDNNISGKGSLIKKGSDTLVLNGNNTYKTNTIDDGTLLLNGKNTASNIVNTKGTLAFGDNPNGISTGSINNKGVISSLDYNKVTINGDLVSTGGIYQAIGSTINVNGNAKIDGLYSVLGVAQGYVTTAGKKETLLESKGLSGNFILDTTPISALIDNKVVVDNTSISVTTNRKTVGDVVRNTGNFNGKTASTEVIDEVLNEYDSNYNKNGLNSKQGAIANEILYSKNIDETLFKYSAETVKNMQNSLSLSEIKQNTQFMKDAQGADGAWISYQYNDAKLSLDGMSGKLKENDVTVGVSKSINQHKFAFGLTNKSSEWNEYFKSIAKNIDVNGLGLDLAYIYKLDNGVNLYTQAGYNHLTYKNSFNDQSANQYSLGVGVNRKYAINDNLVFTPNIGLHYVNTDLNKFKLVDKDVNMSNLNTQQYVLVFGTDIDYAFNKNWSAFASLNLEQDLHNKTKYDLDYAGVNVNKNDSDIGKTRFNGGLGVMYKTDNNFNVSLSANHTQGSKWKSNSGTIKLGYTF